MFSNMLGSNEYVFYIWRHVAWMRKHCYAPPLTGLAFPGHPVPHLPLSLLQLTVNIVCSYWQRVSDRIRT